MMKEDETPKKEFVFDLASIELSVEFHLSYWNEGNQNMTLIIFARFTPLSEEEPRTQHHIVMENLQSSRSI